MLTALILVPLLSALGLLLVPGNFKFVIRVIALLSGFATLALGVALFLGFQTGIPGYQFEHQVEWVKSLNLSYHVGVDGINVGLVCMAAVVAFAAICASWEIETYVKEYYVLLLVMTAGIIGAFASLDMFFFYAFHEFALVPTFIMIGLWGRGERRNYATYQITLYLSLGALIALIGLIGIYIQQPEGNRTFDIPKMTEYFAANPIAGSSQLKLFPLLMFGFGILVSLWPFHTWAPLGYGSAPTATAMLHAGVLKKFGLYGLIRIALPILPEGAHHWLPVLAVLCLGNLVYCGWVAMRQKDLNLLVGNSSVAHMGFIFLGISSLTLIGITGAILVMVAHGLLAALTFGLTGYLRHYARTLEIDKLGGLLTRLPFIGAVLVMALLAGCGVPGFANFAGELLVLFGAWKGAIPHPAWIVSAAAWGALVIGGVYMLRAIRNTLHGPLPENWATMPDANHWRKLPFAVLLVSLIVFGFAPSLLTEKIKPSAQLIVKAVELKPAAAIKAASSR